MNLLSHPNWLAGVSIDKQPYPGFGDRTPQGFYSTLSTDGRPKNRITPWG
jgi:hypothetical protein